MKRYLKYIKPYWIYFILSPILMIIEVYADVMIPSLSAEIINTGITNGDGAAIGFITVKMVIFVALAIFGGCGAAYAASKASVLFSCDLRDDLFKKIQSFSFANIDKFSTGSLVTRLTNDITQLQQLVVMCLRMMFRAPGILIGSLIMAFSINAKISLIFVVLVPFLSVVVYVILKFSFRKFAVLQTRIDALNSSVREVLTNIRVIKALTREKHEDKKFEEVNENLKETGLQAYRITLWQTPIMTIVINFATIAVLWLGYQYLGTGEVEIGDISALITYLTSILGSVSMIAMIFLQGSRAVVSGARVSEVLDTIPDIQNKETQLETQVNSGDIRFENVDFKYYKNNEELVLSNINIDIKSGQTVGIIGSTGCGKTSFVHLIPRLYDADNGSVYVDGKNVKDYSIESLRESVSVVLQNNVLFSGTIIDNLRWGDKDASEQEVKKVATWAAADNFILEQEDKYDTWLDQGGVNLSGGQKQRLCIARALLKKPKILILDDSTSAVDTATERTINSHLQGELSDTTKIIIAQRVSSVIYADMIIVMNDGKIEATGTHEQLLESCLTYQEIHNSQMDKEASGK